MTTLPLLISLLAADPATDAITGTTAASDPTVVVVVGAAGTETYGRAFAEWADRWSAAAKRGEASFVEVGRDRDDRGTDLDRLRRVLATDAHAGQDALWLVLIGHGTFDGRTARFNLRGPDLSVEDLKHWLAPIERPTAVIACCSSSGPFVNGLSAPGRVIVTATKSGYEHNYSRFGDHLSAAIADPAADLDKDGQTSLFEAWLTADRRTADFYEREGRLASEHSLLEDTGDGQAVTADWYEGLRPAKRPEAGSELDGRRSHQWHLVRSANERLFTSAQRRRRDALELDVARLRDVRDQVDEADYFERLERLLVDLAALYEEVDAARVANVRPR